MGAELAEVRIGRTALRATGTAIGTRPLAYVATYALETGLRFVTKRLAVDVRGQGWSRSLVLTRSAAGRWQANVNAKGRVKLPRGRTDLSAVTGALDCDLALSPLTNTMPVLREGLLEKGGPVDFLMAWVSLPDLRVIPSRQRYSFIGKRSGISIVRYESLSSDFLSDLVFDRDGMCVEYPRLARAYRE